jgi:hypothetical protein
MPTYRLPYTYINIRPNPAFPNGQVAPRPIIRLTLVNGESQLTCYAIIDSGADHCVFPRSFMQPLGLDPLTSPIVLTAGLGGTNIPTHFAHVSIDIPGIMKFPVYAGFTTGLEPIGRGLLGQTGFFDRFNLHFKQPERFCYLEIPET